MTNYPKELVQDAVCQSHTGHMIGLWFLPARPLRLNTNEWMMNFWNKTLHVSDSSSVHHQQFFTVHTAMVYVIQLDILNPVWHIPLLCVQWRTADDGQRNCPKHVEFYSKKKFEKLVHLVGFVTRTALYCSINNNCPAITPLSLPHRFISCFQLATKSIRKYKLVLQLSLAPSHGIWVYSYLRILLPP